MSFSRKKSLFACVAALLLVCGPKWCHGQSAEELIGNDVADFGKQYENVIAGVAAFEQGNANLTRQLFTRAKETHPQLPPGDVLLARMFNKAGKLKEAQAALNSAALAFPDDPEAFLLMADVQFAAGNAALAALAFEHGAELTINYDRNPLRLKQLQVRSAAGLAAVAERAGDWSAAEQHLNRWAALDAKHAAVLSRLANVQFQLKKYTEAKKSLTSEAAIAKSKIPAEIKMAAMYDKAKMESETAKEIAAAVAAHPGEALVLLAAAEIELRRGRNTEAKQYIDAALKLEKTSLTAMTLAGRAARQRGDEEKAKEYLNYVAYRSPLRFDAANQLARLLAQSEEEADRQKAAELAELNFRAFSDRNTPTGREAAVTMGWILFRQGKEAQGEAAIAAALRGGSITSESAYLGALVLAKRGKKDLARAILEPIVTANMHFPGDAKAAELLKELK